MADSVIWRVRTEKVGSLEPFKSEYAMEAFLMNNPALIGCWDPEAKDRPPYLVRQQLVTKKGTGDRGRLDVVGLVGGEAAPTVKIFELKVGRITSESVKQLAGYLSGWGRPENAQARHQIQMDLVEAGIAKSIAEKLLEKPTGVLVGSSFDPQAIAEAHQSGIEAIRLARFCADSGGGEYFVVIEDQVGHIVERGRTVVSWQEMGVSSTDRFYIEVESAKGQKTGQKIVAQPDSPTLALKTKRLIFDKESVRLVLKHAEQIIARSDHATAWVKEELQQLKVTPTNPVGIVHATALVCLAFNDRRSFWVPAYLWVRERDGRTISGIASDLKQTG